MLNLQTFAIGIAVAVAVLGAAFLYNLRENAQIREEAAAAERATSERITMETINGIGTKAEQSRAKLRYCSSRGLRYDFGNPGACE